MLSGKKNQKSKWGCCIVLMRSGSSLAPWTTSKKLERNNNVGSSSPAKGDPVTASGLHNRLERGGRGRREMRLLVVSYTSGSGERPEFVNSTIRNGT